jgi:hypothetical protein
LAQLFTESGVPAESFHLREIGLGDRTFSICSTT